MMWSAFTRYSGVEEIAPDLFRIPPQPYKWRVKNRMPWQQTKQENRKADLWERQEAGGHRLSVVWQQIRCLARQWYKSWFLPYKDYNRRLNPQQYVRIRESQKCLARFDLVWSDKEKDGA